MLRLKIDLKISKFQACAQADKTRYSQSSLYSFFISIKTTSLLRLKIDLKISKFQVCAQADKTR